MAKLVLILAVWLSCCFPARADEKPEDRPIRSSQADMDRMVKPYIEMSQKEYPKAKERFLQGLPKGCIFYVTILLFDQSHRKFEQAFIQVGEIVGKRITGTISSKLNLIANYKQGDSITCNEKDVRDWTIVAPDGSEEGNYVGKFLDVVQDNRVPLIVKCLIGKDGAVQNAHFEKAVNRYKQDVSCCIPDSAKRKAEQYFLTHKQAPSQESVQRYGYVIYLFKEAQIEDADKPTSQGQ